MLRIALLCAALTLLASCAPKKVESPLETAPPAQIARARALASSGDIRGAQNAYETFIIGHPGTAEADLARLELGVLGSDIGRCQSAMAHFQQAQDSADQAIALRASLYLGSCQLQLGDPERALQTIEPLAAERFSSEEQALLWDTAVVAAEQTTSATLALQVLDALIEQGGDPPDPQRVDAALALLVQKLTIEETALLFDELRAGALPHVAVSMRLLLHALDTQDAESVVRASDALRVSDSIENPEVTMLVARADEFLHGNPYVVGALLPLSGRGRVAGHATRRARRGRSGARGRGHRRRPLENDRSGGVPHREPTSRGGTRAGRQSDHGGSGRLDAACGGPAPELFGFRGDDERRRASVSISL
ncbi:MAG: tetratricopeptide repeat protein [Deltaproteobacteria bacterium]|nr:tetratricopeptide repeat protein [Deltaproteobacteria bacterium]